MSIVALKKLTIAGRLKDKERVLHGLQELGCLHMIPLKPLQHKLSEEFINHVTEALDYLEICHVQRHQAKPDARFNSSKMADTVIGIRNKIHKLQREVEQLKLQIELQKVWGEFQLPQSTEIGGYHLYFQEIPHYKEAWLKEQTDLIWQVVKRDHRNFYVVFISKTPILNSPGNDIEIDERPLSQLHQRLEDAICEIEDAEAERGNLTRWKDAFRHDINRLSDLLSLEQVRQEAYVDGPIFVLQGWLAATDLGKIQKYAKQNALAVEFRDPADDEVPPTLMNNPEALAPGENLVNFYMTPNYWLWDPSKIVLISFCIFFGIICADAGYALVMGAILALFWRKMGSTLDLRRWRTILAYLVGFSVVIGVLMGSYFGLTPPKGTFFAKLQILDINNSTQMMHVSIIAGVIHLVISNLAKAWRNRKKQTALSSVGWALGLIGGAIAWLSFGQHCKVGVNIGIYVVIAAAVLILLFSSGGKNILKRLLHGTEALFEVTKIFGDTMSYLRLFALGLASTSLAVAFNGLASQTSHALGEVGFLFAIVILLFGHTLNLILIIISGFVHGLRLNFIEFFNWSIKEEGKLFHPFSKKERKS